jgi:hypothetical protein
MKPLYVELTDEDRASLDKLAAVSGVAAGRPLRIADIVRQLVRDAAGKGAPVRIRAEPK